MPNNCVLCLLWVTNLVLKKHRRIAFILSVCFVLLWMAYIFSFSASPAPVSKQESARITEKVVRIYERDYDSLTKEQQQAVFNKVDSVIRKMAHFVLYMVLGVLVCVSCFLLELNDMLKYAVGFLVCVAFAASDEIHQFFTPGRGPLVKDVFIDSSGSFVGFLFVLSTLCLAKRVIKNNNKKD